MTPSILIINYYWPPSGGPAVQRWLSIIKTFVERGIQCYVLTVDENKATYPVLDESLIKQIPEEVKVYKTKTSELFSIYERFIGQIPAQAFANEKKPSFVKKIARFIRGNFFIPDPRKGWNKHAVKKAYAIINKYNIKTIVTAGPPHSTHLIGLKLKTKFNVKWIADFHDYWTDLFYISQFYRTPLAKYVDLNFEKKVLLNSDMILTHCQYGKIILNNKTKKDISNKIHVHTMGYDEKMFFINADRKPQQEFIISYTGMMPENYQPQFLFEALHEIRKKYPNLPMKLRFVGILSDAIKSDILKHGLKDIFEEIGYVNHEKIPSYLKEATVLLLVNPLVENEESIIPGKIYEYLAVRKPIICISSQKSEIAEIIKQNEAGQTFERNKLNKLISYLEDLIEKWLVQKNLDLPFSDKIFMYSRKYEAELLAEKIFK